MAIDLAAQFDAFIDDVSIGEPQTSRMDSAASAIISFLMNKYDLPAANFFLQGSYPNHTAVEPVEGGEYDVDLVAYCVGADTSANSALDTLTDHFRGDGRYKDRIVEKKPCVRLEYAPDDVGAFHVDVVPVRSSGKSVPPYDAPRRDEGWHGTAPAEYTAWCLDQGEPFARTVKALKRWRSEQQSVRTSIKSIVLQVLVSQHLPAASSDAERIGGTLTALHAALSGLTTSPSIWNPVNTAENLAARWTDASFKSFLTELEEAAAWVAKAEAADDVVEACDAWREILGEDFPAPTPQALGLALADTSHEKSFSTRGWHFELDPRYRIAIRAEQQRGKRGQTRKVYDPGGPPVFAGHKLRFKAEFTAPGHCEVWWQVTNTGAHAENERSLRGEFLKAKAINQGPSSDSTEHWESTAYTGVHRVRALLVRDDVVVAVSPYQTVNIWSRDWRRGRFSS